MYSISGFSNPEMLQAIVKNMQAAAYTKIFTSLFKKMNNK